MQLDDFYSKIYSLELFTFDSGYYLNFLIMIWDRLRSPVRNQGSHVNLIFPQPRGFEIKIRCILVSINIPRYKQRKIHTSACSPRDSSLLTNRRGQKV